MPLVLQAGSPNLPSALSGAGVTEGSTSFRDWNTALSEASPYSLELPAMAKDHSLRELLGLA